MSGSGTSTMWNEERARTIIAAEAGRPGAMLPVLHALHDAFGHVPVQAGALIAEALNVSQAEVKGALAFYPDFRSAPPVGRVVKVCRAEACQAVGSGDLPSHMPGLEIEDVYCLGNCALGPSALCEGEPLAHVTPETLRALAQGAAVATLQKGVAS